MTLEAFLGFLEQTHRKYPFSVSLIDNSIRDTNGRCPVCAVVNYLLPGVDYKLDSINAALWIKLSERDRIDIVQSADSMKGKYRNTLLRIIAKRNNFEFALKHRALVRSFYNKSEVPS